MAVDYRSSTATPGTTATYTAAKPTGTIEGDELVAFLNSAELASSHALTGGATWINLSNGTPYGGYNLWWKVAGASEPSTYNVRAAAGTTATKSIIHIVCTSGGDGSTPVFSVTTSADSGLNVATPGITPPDATSLEIRFANVTSSSATAISWASPAGLTERLDTASATSSNSPAMTTATRVLASGSATSSLNFVASAGIASTSGIGVTVGIASGAIDVVPSSIASEEAWGTASLGLNISPSAIASAESFGTVSITQSIALSGIASLEAWGTTVVDAGLRPSSIASEEAWGTASIIRQQPIRPTSIESAEEWGTASLQIGYPITLTLQGIASAEAFGSPSVGLLSRYVLVNPSIQETPAAWGRLFSRFGIHRGITIMKDADGIWSSVRYPAQTEIEAAQTTYMGGHRHKLTAAEAAELTLAGYGQYIELELIE